MNKSHSEEDARMNKAVAFGNTPASGGDDCSSVSSYSNSLENESSSMSSDAILKAAMMLTARRSYPRRSAPTIATGRRNLKSEPVPREEAERRRMRRERNKVRLFPHFPLSSLSKHLEWSLTRSTRLSAVVDL